MCGIVCYATHLPGFRGANHYSELIGDEPMKKSMCLLFVLFVLFVLSSCMRERYPPPLGAWESEEPRMVLYLSRTANPVTGFGHSRHTTPTSPTL